MAGRNRMAEPRMAIHQMIRSVAAPGTPGHAVDLRDGSLRFPLSALAPGLKKIPLSGVGGGQTAKVLHSAGESLSHRHDSPLLHRVVARCRAARRRVPAAISQIRSAILRFNAICRAAVTLPGMSSMQ